MGKSLKIRIGKDKGTKSTKSEPKADKSKSKKAKVREMKVVGKTTGLGVAKTWAKLFVNNEKSSKQQKLTDEQISKAMKKEFPDRGSDIFDHVQLVRNRYNKGVLTGGAVPAELAKRYDKNGNVVTARGKLVD
jgi:hypothetical protein